MRLLVTLSLVIALASPRVAIAQRLQGDINQNDYNSLPVNPGYQDPFTVPSLTSPSQPSQPARHPRRQHPTVAPNGPMQGSASIPAPIQASIQMNDQEAKMGKYKQGSVVTNQGTVYITISDIHCDGWPVSYRQLVPTGYWYYVRGYLTRGANGQDVFHITGLFNAQGSIEGGRQHPTHHDVPLLPDRRVNCTENTRNTQPRSQPKAENSPDPRCKTTIDRRYSLMGQAKAARDAGTAQMIQQQIIAITPQFNACVQEVQRNAQGPIQMPPYISPPSANGSGVGSSGAQPYSAPSGQGCLARGARC
jgi:hypothetical protein